MPLQLRLKKITNMKQIFTLLLLFTLNWVAAQVTILDFETPATSTTYQYFGSTLDGSVNNVIDNPDPTGINTSSKVADHVKPAGSQTWAGAFPNPGLQVPANMISNNQICLKVWFPEPGNVGVKLEGSSTGANWLQLAPVNTVQQWVEVCLDANLPSVEGPNLPATGNIYPVVTLFFNFGVSPTADITYYWDDMILKGSGGATDGDVTFSVDMNDFTGSFTNVFVSGSFNGWSGDANPLSDSDGDGVWTGTLANLPLGVHEYKFTLDNWAAQEAFNGFETCVVTDPSGQFTNRVLVVSGDATLPTYCYNSCYACGDAVRITVNLGATHITPSAEGLYIAGGGNFGNPGDFPLNDGNGDGVWTITLERQKGFTSFYTFTNGACPDYSCKENIAGQDCANPDNFNDRKMGPVMQDTVIATCFAICTDDTNCGGSAPGNVTFQVDLNDYTAGFNGAYISGSFNGWSGDANPLTDADGDGVWEATLGLLPGNYEYKFQLDNWAVAELFNDGDPCTITDPSGQFVNRLISVNGDATVCFQWNTCNSCEPVGTLEASQDPSWFELSPSLASDLLFLQFDGNGDEKEIRVLSATGQIQHHFRLDQGTAKHSLSLDGLVAGTYFVSVESKGRLTVRRFVKI